MAGQLTIDTLKASSGVLATQNGMTGIAKAWVNFNASGVISASFNVSSVTVNATGDFSINFTTAMPDANYAWSGSGQDSNSSALGLIGAWVRSGVSPTASVLRIYIGYSGGPVASPINSVAVFR